VKFIPSTKVFCSQENVLLSSQDARGQFFMRAFTFVTLVWKLTYYTFGLQNIYRILLLKYKTIGKYSRFFRYLSFCFYHLTSPKGIKFYVIMRENQNGDRHFFISFLERMSQTLLLEKVPKNCYMRFYFNWITLKAASCN